MGWAPDILVNSYTIDLLELTAIYRFNLARPAYSYKPNRRSEAAGR